jgi:hypothetical protein
MAKQAERDSRGRFWNPLRVDTEGVPCLPGAAVRFVLDDPRGAPFLFVWQEQGRHPVLSVRVVATS